MGDPEVLPPYSGLDPKCPKCSEIGASTAYIEIGKCTHNFFGFSFNSTVDGFFRNPRLHRECDNCKYCWDEQPLAHGHEKVYKSTNTGVLRATCKRCREMWPCYAVQHWNRTGTLPGSDHTLINGPAHIDPATSEKN